MSDPAVIEADREGDLPHPREVFSYRGGLEAEEALASAVRGRLHHAWLLCGPRGVGKATLAYRFARHLLGAPRRGARPLDVDPEDRVSRLVASGAHPDLLVLRRTLGDRGKLRRDIVVDDARALPDFFALQPAEGGFRVAIIDLVDDLNRNAANAILKTLEEPPPRSLVMLLSQRPGGLLPTIRSRCRKLDLRPAPDADVAAALADAGLEPDPVLLRLAAGRPGRALALARQDATALMDAMLDGLAASRTRGGSGLSVAAFAREGQMTDRLDTFLELAQRWCRRAGAYALGLPPGDMTPREEDILARLAPPDRARPWADAFSALGALRSEAEDLSLDPTHAFLRATAVISNAARTS